MFRTLSLLPGLTAAWMPCLPLRFDPSGKCPKPRGSSRKDLSLTAASARSGAWYETDFCRHRFIFYTTAPRVSRTFSRDFREIGRRETGDGSLSPVSPRTVPCLLRCLRHQTTVKNAPSPIKIPTPNPIRIHLASPSTRLVPTRA